MFGGRSSSPDVPTRSGAPPCSDPRRMSTSSHDELSGRPIDGPPENESNGTDRYSGASSSPSAGAERPFSLSGMAVFDPPSGKNLIHRKAPRSQIVYPSYPNTPENVAEPMEEPIPPGGRKEGKLSPVVYELSKRPFVAKASSEDMFNLAAANADVGAALRMYYRGDKEWDDVCVEIRNALWKVFRMRYQWKPEDEFVIAELWDALCRKRFRQMMYQGKQVYLNGKKKNKLWRPKWMQPSMFNIARYRWDSEPEKKESKRKAINRGVRFGEDGEVVQEAPPTHFSGAVRTMEYAHQIESEGSSTIKFKKMKVLPVESNQGIPKTLPEAYRRTHVANIKEVLEGQSSIENGMSEHEGEDGQGSVISAVQEKWVDTKSRDLFVNYNKKVSQNSESCGGSVERFIPTMWAEFAGGFSHGRMRGVPTGAMIEAGLKQSCSRALPPVPQQESSGDEESRVRSALLERELNETKLELQKQRDEMKKMREDNKSIVEMFNVLKKMATTSSASEIFQTIKIPTLNDDNTEDNRGDES